MRRFFRKTLTYWKDSPLRIPLIVRGARQVGKTFVIESFGREEFVHFLSINFELSPKYRQCFESLEPKAILSQIELLSGQKIVPGKTLLFLDEIQQCPKALQALRYFKEKAPELHVIAAGSLLEFVMNDDQFSFPVGRVQYARLYPLSFEEFLSGIEDVKLQESLNSFDLKNPPPPAVHAHLLQRVKEYFVVGGMAASILAYKANRSLLEVKYAQKALWDSYENDFGKYATKTQHRHLKKILQEGPKFIGEHPKYNRFDPDLPNPAREMKLALSLLKDAGLVHPIHASSGNLPLSAREKTHIFKMIFLDIGLVEHVLDIDPLDAGLMTGPLAEQFVGQELLAGVDPLLADGRLFFWSREKADAEVDYLISHKGAVFPVEVKAGKSGTLRSLKEFIKEKKPAFGIKISQDVLSFEESILSIPLYMVAHLFRLIDSLANSMPRL